MKCTLFFKTLILILFVGTLHAQTKLSDSRRGSDKSYIYTISRNYLRQLHIKSKNITEESVGNYITEYKIGNKVPKLPRGNYIIVRSENNHLVLTDHTVDDLYVKIVPSAQMMLYLYDSLGNIITDAIVKCGNSKLNYSLKTKTYNKQSLKDGQIIEINNKGVYHYITIEKEDNNYYYRKANIFKSTWRTLKRLWFATKENVHLLFNSDERPERKDFTGFIAFSKPKFKPEETVKFKAYMTDLNGKPYDKEVNVRLYSYYPVKVDTVLTTLKPYRPGMFEYKFTLSDTLNLKLDNNYYIALSPTKDKYNDISSDFRYEDYELKGIKFSMKTEKDIYAKSDSVKIKLKVSDENDMAVYDGKVELVVTPNLHNFFAEEKYSTIFISDTLWQHTIDMNGISEKEFVLPDSIFPKNISISYKVACTYLSVDNEKQVKTKILTHNPNNYLIDFSLDKGILSIKELYKGQSLPVKALITMSGENDEVVSSDSVSLPYSISIPWYVSDVSVNTKNAKDFFFLDNNREDQLKAKNFRTEDSVMFKVDNPSRIPFWYSIRKNKKNIKEGYAVNLDYALKDESLNGYSMQVSYLFGGKSKLVEASSPFVRKNMTMEVSTPTSVYPGQKAKVLVSVKDKEGRAINNADITAYSFTSKFENYSMPNITIKGISKYAYKFANKTYTSNNELFVDKKTDMTWDIWKSRMSLDSIEYYKFLFPDILYHYTEPTADNTTMVSPYVVIDGELQGVHMMWIDDRLYYFNQSQQFDIYTFNVDDGKHNFRFRTHDREVSVHNVLLKKGVKNIFSFDASKPYIRKNNNGDLPPFVLVSRLLNKQEKGRMSEGEIKLVSSQLITIDNNFGALSLPNISYSLDLPAYIQTGKNLSYLNYTPRSSYNYTLKGYVNSPILAGPFPQRSFINGMSDIGTVYANGNVIANIEIEGGNRYTLYKGYQKIKDWDKLPFSTSLSRFTPSTDFKERPLSHTKINTLFENRVFKAISEANGAVEPNKAPKVSYDKGVRLKLSLGNDSEGKAIKPLLIFIAPQKKENIKDYQLFYGGTRDFVNLPSGDMSLTLVFSDSTSYTQNISLYPRGQNYVRCDSIDYNAKDEIAAAIFRLFDRNIDKTKTVNPYLFTESRQDSITSVVPQDLSSYKRKNEKKGIISGRVRDYSGEVIIGASVVIEGANRGIVTNLDGEFELMASDGDKIKISFIGYTPKTIKCSLGYDYDIVLEEDKKNLDEVVVVGYGTMKKSNLTGSVSIVDNASLSGVIQGKIPGVMVRGVSSGNNQAPLIIVNGLPFDGKLEDLDPALILSLNVLKDASATSMYGARAANGVVMIETSGAVVKKEQNETEGVEAGNVMRRNFHDDAFWQPRLTTDKKGEATFEVTYPDDITSWNAYFIAIGNKDQADKKQMTIKSFKALTARLSMPRFSVRGDSIRTVGRIANHFGDTISVDRNIETNGQVDVKNLAITSSYVDYIPVNVEQGDSLTVAYSLKMKNGYFDGEERSIPIIEQGMLQTNGDFKVLNDSLIHTFNIDPSLGDVTIHAEASNLDMFLKEIDKVDRYPYMCNEQMASKIKVLLSKKQIYKILGKEFKDDQKIRELINKLNKNRNNVGLWGWWNKETTVSWISKQILETLLNAEDAGYKTEFDKFTLCEVFKQELKMGLSDVKLTTPDRIPFGKQELLDRLILLKRMNAPIDYQSYLKQIDSQLKSRTIMDKMKTMQAMSVIGMKDEIQIDSIMKYSQKTMLGSIYWGNGKSQIRPLYLLPYENDIENTLIVYNILKNIGGQEAILTKIRNYFFECRSGGSWQNTYQSSRVVEAIMPDMLAESTDSFKDVTMFFNNRQISKFPYTEKVEASSSIHIKKVGTLPLFVTVYQQNWNPTPQKESKKGFMVKTVFVENKDTIASLTAGKAAKLEVMVDVDADAEYVQIEVPIPAGCTYDNKMQSYYWKEVHREYFKAKVVIFSNRLTKGKHQFIVDLMPRYGGRYSVNPAKVELMYFPTFYGNEEMKKVMIKGE